MWYAIAEEGEGESTELYIEQCRSHFMAITVVHDMMDADDEMIEAGEDIERSNYYICDGGKDDACPEV